MLIQGALSGASGAVTTEEFLRFLSERVPGGHCFLVDPPPGITMAAAIDWRVVLVDVADATRLATALWQAYETFVEPLHKGASPGAVVTVQVRNARGQFDQFILGKEITEEAALSHRMKESVRLLCAGEGGEDARLEIERTVDSGYWVNITEL